MEARNQQNVMRRTVVSLHPDTPIPQPDPRSEISETRILPAARDRVLKAFSDHDLVGQWWGPEGFRTVTKHLDFRPGGIWQHVLKGRDRMEYTNYVMYLQTGPEIIDYVHGADEHTIDFRAIITLEELTPDQTQLHFRMICESPAVRDQNFRDGADDALKSTLSRLEALLSDPHSYDI
jgi:uncharacterized protein YndB with AHSA1/START domain